MIDWDRLRQLRDEVGDEDFSEVADLFLAEIDQVVARLSGAPDPASYEADLHFIKSSSLNLGFRALSDLCQIGERAAAEGRADTVGLAPILATYQQSRAAFAEFREQTPPPPGLR
jgi:HPt (histidine-containing phosphotransfer) domain-containing protein